MSNSQEMQELYLEWKKKYTQAIIDRLKPSGDVLQVGFEIEAANYIQAFKPKSHTIIEENASNELLEWSKEHSNVSIIQARWQTALPKLGVFDAVFFNQYPQEDVSKTIEFLFCQEMMETREQVKKVLSTAEKAISNITTLYSDQQIEEFYQKIGRLNPKELPTFFRRMRANGNISESQYNNAFKKYNINDLEQGIPRDQPKETLKEIDPMCVCLEKCLKDHMHPGSRFSCYMNGRVSKYEDGEFFDRIITNPMVDYQEIQLSIALSGKPREGLMVLVTKN